MSRPAPLPPQLQRAPFAVREAIQRGVTPGRLRAADLSRPFWGVRSPGEVEELRERCRAYLTRMAPGGLFSHVTAARLHGIPLPRALELRHDLDVSVPAPSRAIRAQGIFGHKVQLNPNCGVEVDGLPLTSMARTWCDLAMMLRAEDLIAAGDFLIWRRRPLGLRLDPTALRDAVVAYPGRRGKPLLRSALPRLSDRADSPPESKLRIRIEDAGLPKPAVNFEIYDEFGLFVAMCDLAFPDYKESLDYEGEHHLEKEQWAKDLRRVPRIEAEGWHHTRMGAEDLRDSWYLISRLKKNLFDKGWRP